MKLSLSLATVAACLSAVSALETVYVTQLHTVTIDPNNPVPSSSSTPTGSVVTVTLGDESTTTPAAATTTTPAAAAATTSSSTTPATSSATGTSNLSSFASAILDASNAKRALHSAPDLVWDETVAAYAQAYADKYDCSGSLTHSGGKYGENLAVGFLDGPAAVTAWYNEVNDYSYLNPSYDHFTQLVWKSTTKLGCAIKDCSANNWGHYVICSYDPAGNVVGQLAANVLAN